MTKMMIWVAVMAALTGCNTISGVGMDITAGATLVSGWMGG